MASTTEHNLEKLITALNHFQTLERACAFNLTDAGAMALPRAEGRLEDAAVDCGMDRLHGDLVGWASERVAAWLMAA
jgi:hypothetical protein